MNTKASTQAKQAITNKLSRYFAASLSDATLDQVYKATAMVVNDMLLEKRQEFHQRRKEQKPKKIYYLCMEFLMGRSLKNNLYNLGLTETVKEVLKGSPYTLEDLYEHEPDAGLGNGGLGRLAACFMDALAAQEYPAMGFSIRYEYGLFKQRIVDGWHTELPDVWLPGGEVWLSRRDDTPFVVKFGGHVYEEWTENGLKTAYTDYESVEAVPYDMLVSGADSNAVNVLRLWKACNISNFDMKSFANGDYARASLVNTNAEIISKVLYPADNHQEGKELRLKQQYFLVSASIQNIVNDHIKAYGTLDNFAEKVAIHINDTHPALCVPELMRIFMDEHGYSWDDAFKMVVGSVAYTNHTVLAEALEKWPEDMIARLIPRCHSIIKELNNRFCGEMWQRYPGHWDKIDKMAILSRGEVRMANLSIIGSHCVNGVSALHSEILKKEVFKDFAQLYPERFTNVTNGIAYRRWLCQSNPRLTALLDECIGTGYKKDAMQLDKFLKYQDDKSVLDRLDKIKLENKKDFAEYVKNKTGLVVNPNSVFDVQVKRLHEYKRQLMNALRLLSIYTALEENPNLDIRPQTYFFAAKAAPSYYHAKEVISLICALSAEIEKNPRISEKLKVVFLENYCATLAEHLMPASEISEQISLAGKEASGTGNMKLMINGSVTIGTMDGANVEIYNEVGPDNVFIFGLNEKEVNDVWQKGYRPSVYCETNPDLRRAINRLHRPINGVDFTDLAQYLLSGSHGIADPYMCIADFADYNRVHNLMLDAYEDRTRWNKMSLVNIAKSGVFSADRSIREYSENIWNIEPVK